MHIMISRRSLVEAVLGFAGPLAFRLWPALSSYRDHTLVILSDELRRVENELRHLLNGDDRDAIDIPGYLELADRQAVLIQNLCRIPASEERGLLAKARAVSIRDAGAGFDGAISISISLASDVVAVLSASFHQNEY